MWQHTKFYSLLLSSSWPKSPSLNVPSSPIANPVWQRKTHIVAGVFFKESKISFNLYPSAFIGDISAGFQKLTQHCPEGKVDAVLRFFSPKKSFAIALCWMIVKKVLQGHQWGFCKILSSHAAVVLNSYTMFVDVRVNYNLRSWLYKSL